MRWRCAVIPAGGVVLKPGGTHVMLMDLKEPVTGKEKIEIDLKFENAVDIRVEAPVKSLSN
jgi:copper(I)-binding protein